MNLKKLERYLRVNMLGPGRGLTEVEKHWIRRQFLRKVGPIQLAYVGRSFPLRLYVELHFSQDRFSRSSWSFSSTTIQNFSPI